MRVEMAITDIGFQTFDTYIEIDLYLKESITFIQDEVELYIANLGVGILN